LSQTTKQAQHTTASLSEADQPTTWLSNTKPSIQAILTIVLSLMF
jgi:hypothetical protein